MSESDEKKALPAYVSYKSFIRFLRGLQPGHLPSSINSSVLTGMSGSVQSATLKTLEFLKLTVDGRPTDRLDKLVAAQGPEFSAELTDLLHDAYPFIFKSHIDLRRATTQEVSEAFRKQGISGSTTVKAMAFFLAACKDAKIEVSKYVKTPQLTKSNAGKKSSARNGGQDAGEGGDERDDDDVEDVGSRGTFPGVDPALVSLMEKLPMPGEPMTKKERDRFAAFFSAVLTLLYPEAEQ